jgi:prepilin-type N-terminal cleavage/methylation domain-containing protein
MNRTGRGVFAGRDRNAVGRAFTLVELLVVISIIALLISILLPSLKSARDQAKTLKCQSNLAAIAKAGLAYATEESDWIPGSPGTTGAQLHGPYAGLPGDAEIMPGAPVQTWDYAGPLAAVQMNMSSLPQNRAERWKILIEDVFECPSNRFLSVPFWDEQKGPHNSFGSQRMVSYNTVRNFLYWPRSEDGGGAPYLYASFDRIGGDTRLPRNFKPRVDLVGQPSEKVFLTDSSRFTEAGEVDHDIDWNANAGGGFSTGGPSLREQFLRAFWLEDPERRFSYRHGSRNSVGIAVAFFDGHAERLTEEQSRFPDRWWPKGTVVPWSDMNRDTRNLVLDYIDQMTGEWTVRR